MGSKRHPINLYLYTCEVCARARICAHTCTQRTTCYAHMLSESCTGVMMKITYLAGSEEQLQGEVTVKIYDRRASDFFCFILDRTTSPVFVVTQQAFSGGRTLGPCWYLARDLMVSRWYRAI